MRAWEKKYVCFCFYRESDQIFICGAIGILSKGVFSVKGPPLANDFIIIPNCLEKRKRAKKRKVFYNEVPSETIIHTNKLITAQYSFKRNIIFTITILQ